MRDDYIDENLSHILNESNIEEKEEEKEKKAIRRYFFYSILLLILICISVVYFEQIKTSYNDLINKYILKAEKNEVFINKNLQASKQIVKEKKIIVEKIVKIRATKDELLKMFNTNNFNLYECSNYPINKFQLNATCKSALIEFLKNNKNAFRFEVIPVLGKRDVKDYLKYKSYLEEILMAGISAKRANEMVLNIKEQLSKDTIITPKDHYIKSEKQTSSVMVKAYH